MAKSEGVGECPVVAADVPVQLDRNLQGSFKFAMPRTRRTDAQSLFQLDQVTSHQLSGVIRLSLRDRVHEFVVVAVPAAEPLRICIELGNQTCTRDQLLDKAFDFAVA